jgi:hypothetical protein
MFLQKQRSLIPWIPTHPKGIKLGKNKLKAIKDVKPPRDVKTIRSFVGLCTFFQMNIIADITECFDAFQADLINLQKADTNLQHMNYFWVKRQ